MARCSEVMSCFCKVRIWIQSNHRGEIRPWHGARDHGYPIPRLDHPVPRPERSCGPPSWPYCRSADPRWLAGFFDSRWGIRLVKHLGRIYPESVRRFWVPPSTLAHPLSSTKGPDHVPPRSVPRVCCSRCRVVDSLNGSSPVSAKRRQPCHAAYATDQDRRYAGFGRTGPTPIVDQYEPEDPRHGRTKHGSECDRHGGAILSEGGRDR